MELEVTIRTEMKQARLEIKAIESNDAIAGVEQVLAEDGANVPGGAGDLRTVSAMTEIVAL